jgi:hypothetical protein
MNMFVKFTFLFRNHEETRDTDAYLQFLQTKIIPKILQVNGVSHVEVCHFVPFSFGPQPNSSMNDQKHLLQMDIYYNSFQDFQLAMANFNDAYLVNEIAKAASYTDTYISYITEFANDNMM